MQNSNNPTLCGLPPSRKVDEYGNINLSDEKMRLEKFGILLDSDENLQGVIVAYGGSVGRVGEAIERADRAKGYLVNKQVFYNSRINTVDCGYLEVPVTELWITPVGAAPPVCTPMLNRTDAQFKGRPRRRSLSHPASNKPSQRRRR
jgi:hypothetical protein